MKKKKRKKLYRLLKQWTRAEVMARLGGEFSTLNFIDFAQREVELRNKIRKLLYGTSSLVELGLKWKLLKPSSKKGKKTFFD